MTDLDAVLRAEERLETAGMIISFKQDEIRQLLDLAHPFARPEDIDDYKNPKVGRWGCNYDVRVYPLGAARRIVAAARARLDRDKILAVTWALERA